MRQHGKLALLLFASSILHAEDVLTGQGGVALPVNTWVKVTPRGYGPTTTGYDSLEYVGALGCHMGWGLNYHRNNNN